MASAGVVGYAEVMQPNSVSTNRPFAGSPSMWSYIWVGLAIMFLFFVHTAMRGR